MCRDIKCQFRQTNTRNLLFPSIESAKYFRRGRKQMWINSCAESPNSLETLAQGEAAENPANLCFIWTFVRRATLLPPVMNRGIGRKMANLWDERLPVSKLLWSVEFDQDLMNPYGFWCACGAFVQTGQAWSKLRFGQKKLIRFLWQANKSSVFAFHDQWKTDTRHRTLNRRRLFGKSGSQITLTIYQSGGTRLPIKAPPHSWAYRSLLASYRAKSKQTYGKHFCTNSDES